MNAIVKLTLPALVAGAMFAAADFAGAQQPVAQGVVSTWTLVSETAHQGGKTTEPLGPNPLGSVMFDSRRTFHAADRASRPSQVRSQHAGRRNAGGEQGGTRGLARLYRDILGQRGRPGHHLARRG